MSTTSSTASDKSVERKSKREEEEPKRKRMWIMIALILLLAGAAAAVGIIFGSKNNGNDKSALKVNEDDRRDNCDTPTIMGKVPTITKIPTDAPTVRMGPEGYNDGYNPDAPPTPCNTLPDTQELGI